MLAPLRFGAGLKGKCINSMQAGTPSVTTLVGAEGISSATDWPGFVEEDAQTFCSSAVKLYQDQNLWEQKQKQGYEILKSNFNKNDFQSIFKARIDETLEYLKDSRRKNVIGELLKHHHHRSTKYLSLWIQAKNK